MAISTDTQLIEQLLSRGVENIYPKEDFLRSRLLSGEQLKIYTGYDPTAPTLHVGHGITLLKLRDFQRLGHKIIFLIGDFTGMIGDPDKSAARTKLTHEQVLENCKLYQEQASAILDFDGDNPAETRFNSEWLGKLNFADVVELTSHFTVQQLYTRDMFRRRMNWKIACPNCGELVLLGRTTAPPSFGTCKKCMYAMVFSESDGGLYKNLISPTPVYLHEFLYPVMQGYDCVAMDVDGEVGGNDQTFNMLAGRTLMKDLKNKEKFVIAGKLLTDSSGKKMGKSEGNMIAFNDTAEDMFGKIMSWTDEMIVPAFEICTRMPMEKVNAIKQELASGANPRDAKLKLACEITKTFLDENAAQAGQFHFQKVIQGQDHPDDIEEITPSAYDIVTVLVESKLCSSNGDARRNIDGGGVKVNDEKVENYDVEVKSGDVIQKGKRHFVKVS